MKRLSVLMVSLGLALTLSACGGEPAPDGSEPAGQTGDEASRAGNSTPVPGSSAGPENASGENPGAGNGLTDFLGKLTLIEPGDAVAGTGWEFAGGMADGVEMEQAEADQTLAVWGGKLNIVFGEGNSVSMVQGNGTLKGSYETVEGNTYVISLVFDNAGAELRYAGIFADMGGTEAFMLLPDDSGRNAIYFSRIAEGGSQASQALSAFLANFTLVAPDGDYSQMGWEFRALANTGWQFSGGMIAGVEMEDQDLQDALTVYGGVLNIVFDSVEPKIFMIQGNGMLEGTWGIMEDGYLMDIVFQNGDSQLRYTGALVLTDAGQEPVLMLFSDDTAQNIVYLTHISEH